MIRTTGLLLGVAVAGLYEFLVCIAPPDDFDHMKPKTFLLMYVGGPLLMIMGAFWLADRIARRFDHRHISLSGD